MVFSFLGGRSGVSRDPSAAQKFVALQAVRAYWEGLRGPGGSLPARAAIDPRGLAPALDSVFVGERIGTGLLRLRISGMALTDIAGLDMKGLPISTLFLPESRLRLAQVIERVFTLPEVAELHLEAERTIGRPALSARLLLLPLRAVDGSQSLVLGCLATDGQVGRAPRRFAILRAVEERLVSDAPVLPAAADPAPQPAFAEPPAPALRRLPGRPHLRLVHSAD
jgi:hypothetical protein